MSNYFYVKVFISKKGNKWAVFNGGHFVAEYDKYEDALLEKEQIEDKIRAVNAKLYKSPAHNLKGIITTFIDPATWREANREAKSRGNCIVATLVYFPNENYKINYLREFRDEKLLKTFWGKCFVDLYYEHGIKLAKFIKYNKLILPSKFLLNILIKVLKTLKQTEKVK